MIYLNPRVFSARPPGLAGLATHGFTPWALALAAAWLILVLAAWQPRAVSTGATPLDGPAVASQEQRHWQGLMEALRGEGAILGTALCHARDVCVRVTALFRGLRPGDKRSIGRGIARYFETRPGDALPVRHVRFLDANSGRELGRYAFGRLEWEGQR